MKIYRFYEQITIMNVVFSAAYGTFLGHKFATDRAFFHIDCILFIRLPMAARAGNLVTPLLKFTTEQFEAPPHHGDDHNKDDNFWQAKHLE